MAIVKLGSHLPDGDKNGLVRISPALVDDPHGAHVVVMVIDCKQLTTNTEDDSVTPLARIRHIEPLASADDVTAATAMLRRAFEQRTGKVELPFEMVQDEERVKLTERSDFGGEAGDLPDVPSAPDDGEHPASTGEPVEHDPDAPAPWDYQEGEGQPEQGAATGEGDGVVRAFRSPFQAPASAGSGS